jgi:hypothetical protein
MMTAIRVAGKEEGEGGKATRVAGEPNGNVDEECKGDEDKGGGRGRGDWRGR